MQQFQTALSSDPSNPDAYYNLASTYHKVAIAQKDQQLIDQAESLYNQCLDLSPNHVDCHRALAVLLAESGRPDSAVRLLKNWAGTNPQNSDPRIELGRLYQELGENQLAEQYLDEALAVNPSDYRAWTAKGQMREASGDLNQALQNYQQSLALNSLQPDIYQRVASLNVRIAQNSLTNPPSGTGWTAQTPQPGAAPRY
jgi:tetratricopeptide (TPR) repeat protein